MESPWLSNLAVFASAGGTPLGQKTNPDGSPAWESRIVNPNKQQTFSFIRLLLFARFNVAGALRILSETPFAGQRQN
jgi:hypothetical protein